MSLTVANNIARQGLAASALATSVASRNIANVGNPNAAAKSLATVSSASGGILATSLVGAIDAALFERTVSSGSKRSMLETVAGGLEQLSGIVGDPQAATSPAARIGSLMEALQSAAGAPQDVVAARGAIAAAQEVVETLNSAAQAVTTVRRGAQSALVEGVARLGSLLQGFGKVNDRIIAGSAVGDDVTDDIDLRNAIVREVSELVGVRSVVRDDNDMLLFLGNGATLFESTSRQVEVGNGALQPGQSGPAIRIDGINMASASSVGGKLGGLLQLRDEVAVTVGRQLDEIARGLMAATAESDQSATPTLPDIAGLFTTTGATLPTGAILVDGLAARIKVNANVDPDAGGDVMLLRDGAIGAPSNPAYRYNTSGGYGFSGRLTGLIDALAGAQAFDPTAGLDSAVGVSAYAADAAGWLEGERAQTTSNLEDARVLNDRTTTAWQNSVGINHDGEMATLISLQRSYQASTRILSAVGGMFDALLAATR